MIDRGNPRLKLARPAGRHTEARVPEHLGDRIRQIRTQLGLSLAAVSGKDFSRSFLNQIELGRARPSMRTLQVIADRLQRPIEYFLQDPGNSSTALELLLIEAGTRMKQGDAEKAKKLMTEVLQRKNLPLEIRTRAQLLLAEAEMRLGDPTGAVSILNEAIRAAETSHWAALAIELYDRMGSAFYLLRRPHEASRWWDRAMTAFEGLDHGDPLLKARILGHRANLYYIGGQPTDAIACYQEAIAVAGHVLDIQTLAGIYEGLALSFHRTGRLSRALEYGQRSLRLFETLQDVRMSAQLRGNMATILLERGHHSEAERLFLEGAENLERVGDRDLLPNLISGAAEAALEAGRLESAGERVRRALEIAPDSRDPLSKLAAERVAGRVAHAIGDTARSNEHFRRALDIAKAMDSPLDRSRVAYDYAQVLEAQGEASDAIVHYREAYEARRAASGT